MPKPRTRKPSRGDDIDPAFSSSTSQVRPAESEESVEATLSSPVRPVVRRRVGSKGASPSLQVTSRSSTSNSQDELLTSSPVRMPAPRARDAAGEKSASMQVQPLHQKSRADPPIPRKRHNKTSSESEVQPKASPATAPTYQQVSLRTRKKGGGIRMPLWKAPPPPTWTPPATPTPNDPTRKEK